MGYNLEFLIYFLTVTVSDIVINNPCVTENKNLVALIIVKLQKKNFRRMQKKWKRHKKLHNCLAWCPPPPHHHHRYQQQQTRRKRYFMTLAYFLNVTKNKNLNISETVRASAKCMGVFCRFWHLPSNVVIATFLLRDLDLLFEG